MAKPKTKDQRPKTKTKDKRSTIEVKIQEFKSTNFRQMSETRSKLIHTFGALAELGQEVANRNDFHETMRTSLHLLLGSLAIMRGGVARFSRFEHTMQMVACTRAR
jgi:hypothetical protein